MLNDQVRMGGLMRCCAETIDRQKEPSQEGDELRCVWCAETMHYRGGAWQWSPPVGLTD